MKRLIFYFIILLIAIWIGLQIQTDSGYVLITYRKWTIETSLWLAVFILFLTYSLLYAFMRFIKNSRHLSQRLHTWSFLRRKRKANSLTSQGLCQLAEGHWKHAEKTLLKAARDSDTPLINYLAAAKAAQEQQAFNARDDYLKQAADSTESSEIAVGLTKAQLQLKGQQLEQALATLQYLNQQAPKHSFVLKLLVTVSQKLNDWTHIKNVLPQLKKQKIFSSEDMHSLELLTYQALLKQLCQKHDATAIENMWHALPKKLKQQSTCVLMYTQQLLQQKQNEKALQLLARTLNKTWDATLMEAYCEIQAEHPKKQLKTAQAWIKKHGESANILYYLGRLCMQYQWWEQARDYLAQSANKDEQPNTFFDLARVMHSLGQHRAALEYYQKLPRYTHHCKQA